MTAETAAIVPSRGLATGTSSCGCLFVEAVAKGSRKTHGHSSRGAKHKITYTSWLSIRKRCLNPADPYYPKYGGAGITICDEWEKSFQRFLEDMGPRPSTLHTIDRIDNEKGYEPNNCRWATWVEQHNNRRDNIRVTAFGKTQTVAQWAREMKMNRYTLRDRLLRGEHPETAMTYRHKERWNVRRSRLRQMISTRSDWHLER